MRDHLEEFLHAARAHDDGTGVPAFVETAPRRFLTCGVLAHGFTRSERKSAGRGALGR